MCYFFNILIFIIFNYFIILFDEMSCFNYLYIAKQILIFYLNIKIKNKKWML